MFLTWIKVILNVCQVCDCFICFSFRMNIFCMSSKEFVQMFCFKWLPSSCFVPEDGVVFGNDMIVCGVYLISIFVYQGRLLSFSSDNFVPFVKLALLQCQRFTGFAKFHFVSIYIYIYKLYAAAVWRHSVDV